MRPLIYKREKPDFRVDVSARGSIVPRKLPSKKRSDYLGGENETELVASNREQKLQTELIASNREQKL